MDDTCQLCGVTGHNRQTCPNTPTPDRIRDITPTPPTKPIAQALTQLTETIQRLDEKTGQLCRDLEEILRPADPNCSTTATKELPTSPLTQTINNHTETLQTIEDKIEDILTRLEI